MKITEGNEDLKRQLVGTGLISCYFGGDPEFFVSDEKGVILNSDRFFPGKENPRKVTRPDDGFLYGKVYFDGIQAELGFTQATCRETVIARMGIVLNEVRKIISGPAGNKIVLKPAVKVKKAIINLADPQARIFGCAPDFNAYTRSVNTPPMDASRHLYRYAGGHIHLGKSDYDSEGALLKDPENHLKIIKTLDLIVSLPLLALDNGPGSKLRRTKYGKAGCFRPTPYGLEYRTPSCWWLQSPVTAGLILGLARIGWTLAVKDLIGKLMTTTGVAEEDIRGIVEEGDIKSSLKIWDKIRPYITAMGTVYSNPIHRMAFCPFVPKANKSIANGKFNEAEVLDYGTLENPNQVAKFPMPLAMFEYMLKNGIESVIENVDNEWVSYGGGMYNHGMFSGTEHKMGQPSRNPLADDVRKDFFKFQKAMLKELY